MTTVPRITSTRIAADVGTTQQQLGLLANLAGTWEGAGFNLIARPDFHDDANLYLQLNQTRETLTITPIGSPIPNRGFGQDDIELFGLSYLQRIEDAATGGALHFEPGLWVTQPPTSYPEETTGTGDQIIFREGSIPHGTSLLAEGIASTFNGPPLVESSQAQYAFSVFPSFNSTPFPISAAGQPPTAINAAGSSEKLTAQAAGIKGGGFQQYDLTVPDSLQNPRTPFDTDPPDLPLPVSIDGVPMQTVVNDPIALIQAAIKSQEAEGCQFSGVALNIATQPQVVFLTKPNNPDNPNSPPAPRQTVTVANGGGSLGNMPFLLGASTQEPNAPEGPNAQSALVYATFWIEHVTPPKHPPFMQLQYAQFTQLNFPIFTVLHPTSGTPALASLGWPHVSVATLRKSFG